MRCAVRSAAARPGTDSCTRSATPNRSAAVRSGWPTPTRPIRGKPRCTGIIRTTAARLTTPRSSAAWPPTTGGPCPHPPRHCLPLLALCPPGVRVAAWHKGDRPTRSRWPLHAWEPVIYHGGRQLVTGQRRADSLVCGVGPLDTLPGRVIGAKPAAVCRWIFSLLGAGPADTLDDLFPGSGAGQPGLGCLHRSAAVVYPGGRRVVQGPGRRVVPGRERHFAPVVQGLTRRLCPAAPGICPVTCPHPFRGWPRILERLAAWPLVSGQSASGGSMSRVAEGHFRRKREAPLILRGSTSQFRGHPRT